MDNPNYILNQFKTLEDYPEATEDSFINFLNDTINNSATNIEEAKTVLNDYLDFIKIDHESLRLSYLDNHFEVYFNE